MPELPEVETTCRGVAPHINGQKIISVKVHQPSLRWPVSAEVGKLAESKITRVWRRAKYVLIAVSMKGEAQEGTLIIHLGMSGSLRICSGEMPLRKHDHAEFELANGKILRFHDPRRFGCILWCAGDIEAHKLIAQLGPEPLSDDFDGAHLFKLSRKRKVSLKNFIMDGHTVVGVGNIYASESLFCAGLRPGRSASRVTSTQYDLLAIHIKKILAKAIDMGGTTLRDFVNSEGAPGYFSQQLLVYGRAGDPCGNCGSTIKNKVIGQRSSFYCPTCQK